MFIVGKAACLSGDRMYMGPLLSIQFCQEPKTALKSKVYFRERKKILPFIFAKEKSGRENMPLKRK